MTGVARIAAERQRQIEQEGWTPARDDEHDKGELAITAACYAVHGLTIRHADNAITSSEHPVRVVVSGPYGITKDAWLWASCDDKRDKHSQLRRLEIAGALIAAEIDRLQRQQS